MNKNHLGICLGIIAAGVTLQASAQITGLYNTGVDNSRTRLADGSIGDPHYSLVGVPGGTTDIRVRTSVGGFPIPPYLGDNSKSAWIGPNNDNVLDGNGGTYDYRTTFTVGATGERIFGQMAADDIIFNGGVLLNGIPLTATAGGFGSWSPFSIPAGSLVVNGVNTLDFMVFNSGGPTALRVELSTTGVPDSSLSLALIAGVWALVVLPGTWLRRNRLA